MTELVLVMYKARHQLHYLLVPRIFISLIDLKFISLKLEMNIFLKA